MFFSFVHSIVALLTKATIIYKYAGSVPSPEI